MFQNSQRWCLLGRTSSRFLWCWLLLFFIHCFLTFLWCCSSFLAFRRHPSPFRELSPAFYTHFILSVQLITEWFTFILTFLGPSFTVLPRVLRIWESVFYYHVFFTLHSFPTFGRTCLFQGFPGSPQFFVEGCRASLWGLKHRPSPFICLNYTAKGITW